MPVKYYKIEYLLMFNYENITFTKSCKSLYNYINCNNNLNRTFFVYFLLLIKSKLNL